jgi:hypothetical protein
MEVDAVASVWVDVGFKLAGVRECCTDSSGYTSEGWVSSCQARSTYRVRVQISGVNEIFLENTPYHSILCPFRQSRREQVQCEEWWQGLRFRE